MSYTYDQLRERDRLSLIQQSMARDCPVCPSKVGERCVAVPAAKRGVYIVNLHPHKERHARS